MTVLSMAQAAAEIGAHYDTFRKGWRRLRRERGFPGPIDTGMRTLRWDAEAIVRWKAARQLLMPRDDETQVCAANDAHPLDQPYLAGHGAGERGRNRADADRARLLARMAGAR